MNSAIDLLNSPRLDYHRFTLSDYKDIGIRKFKIVQGLISFSENLI